MGCGTAAEARESDSGWVQKKLTGLDCLAQAKERKLDIDPIAGDELEKLAREVIAQPSDVVERE